MTRTTPIALVLLLTLTGCGGTVTFEDPDTPATPEPITVSAECAAAIDELAAVEPGDTTAEEAAIVASTTACTTVEEYILAVKDNPGSWWATDADAVEQQQDTIIQGACSPDPSTPMCQDAEVLGFIQ